MISTVPAARIRSLNTQRVNPSGRFVLYWMIGARRLRCNFALQHAVDLARALERPLLIVEPLDADYAWASDRVHRFVLDGMADNLREASATPAMYVPYVEPGRHQGRGLFARVAADSSVVVVDDSPAFILAHVRRRMAEQSPVAVEAVDSTGLIPLSRHGRAFTSARSYRAFAQRELPSQLAQFPEPQPLRRLPRSRRLAAPPASLGDADHATVRRVVGSGPATVADLPIDHFVAPVRLRGGSRAAARRLSRFVTSGLPRYAEGHAHPDEDCTSRLSPYLHFGHVSPHEIFAAVMTRERWTSRRLAARGGGRREGWWGTSEGANLFLDQLVVWRELAYNGCEWTPDYASYESLPAWARETLAAHADDPRDSYDFATLESASTRDEIWNAAQRQLRADGWFHGYLRMLWGKKILEWAPDPPTALAWMEQLMNRYALDGRDPVSYAGFTWTLGRYDRPWPRRPVFGTVRAMSSQSTRRKLRMRAFLQRYGASAIG